MADLDDFFAKKDRKKSKGKKFTTTDEIAKKLEETGKKLEKAKKDKTTMQSQPPGTETDEQGNAIQEEDEWREFEEQKKDYSGLRIGKLQLQEAPDDGGGDEDGEEEQVLEENEAGEMVLRSRKVQTGPWKMQQQQLLQQQQQASPAPLMEERPSPPPSADIDTPEKRSEGASTYRPPALRNSQQREFSASIGGPRTSRMKTAPDISNEESFPTLSASKNMDANSSWGRRRRDEGTFEEVRKGGNISSRVATGGPKLNLGNKFGALQDQS